MKILWFTNNAVNLNKGLTRGGWMQSLEHHLALDETLQLYIATRYSGKALRRITEQNTTYLLIPDSRNLLQKRIDIVFNREPINKLIQQYLTVIDEIKPDVIHVFGTEMEYGLMSGLTDIPVVIHIQGILHPYYYHLTRIKLPFFKALYAQRMIDILKGSTLQNGLRIFKRRVGIERKIYETARYFMGRTDWDQQITHLLSPNACYFHCDEMLRPCFLEADWTHHATETLNVVSIISSPLYKGHETLVATCRVLKETATKNLVWHVIGLDTTTPSYRIFYKPYMKSLTGHIQMHGELTAEAIIKILQHADIYVHPSHIENSSNSICEAMALGMPVIALHTGGNASLINHGVDGLLVADHDPYTLAATIQQVVSNPEQSQKMASYAKKRATTRHHPDRIIADLKAIYQKVIELHANKK